MIKITEKNGKLKVEMRGSAFEILNEAIVISKALYESFNEKLPYLGDYYLHRINTDFKKEENEEEGEEENEEDNSVHPRHQRHRRD